MFRIRRRNNCRHTSRSPLVQTSALSSPVPPPPPPPICPPPMATTTTTWRRGTTRTANTRTTRCRVLVWRRGSAADRANTRPRFRCRRSTSLLGRRPPPPPFCFFLNVEKIRRRYFYKLSSSPGIDFASLCSLAGLYDSPIPTRFLAPTDCCKIPTLEDFLLCICCSFFNKLYEEFKMYLYLIYILCMFLT